MGGGGEVSHQLNLKKIKKMGPLFFLVLSHACKNNQKINMASVP